MTGKEYQHLAARTINKDLMEIERMHHALLGMAGEVGEVHSIHQKVYQGHLFDDEHMKKELGDLLWFIAEYCTTLHYDLDEIMEKNINKLKERYPEGFSVDKSLNRKEGDI